jgi:topoisomerase IA-like protein
MPDYLKYTFRLEKPINYWNPEDKRKEIHEYEYECNEKEVKEEVEKEVKEEVEEEVKNKILGEYKDNNLYLKHGIWGYYLECGELKKSLKYVKINVPIKNIGYDDAVNILKDSEANVNSLVREIDETLSIRKGKYGEYIFYKTEKMEKPQFFKLNGFNDNYKNCSLTKIRSWIKEKYLLNI